MNLLIKTLDNGCVLHEQGQYEKPRHRIYNILHMEPFPSNHGDNNMSSDIINESHLLNQ